MMTHYLPCMSRSGPCKLSVCYFDVWPFVSKTCTAVLWLISSGTVLRAFWKPICWVITLRLAQIKFSVYFLDWHEYPGLVSFWMDWLDLLAVQGALKSFLQHHSSKASVLRPSAFFIAQLSHPYMTTGKTISLTRWTFVGKVMSLLFNILSRFVIDFLPRRKRLLISWLQSSSAVILEPKKIKFLVVSIVFPSICHEVIGPDAVFLVFWMLSFKPAFHSPLSPSY